MNSNWDSDECVPESFVLELKIYASRPGGIEPVIYLHFTAGDDHSDMKRPNVVS